MSPAAHTLFLDGRIPLAIFASGSGSNAEAIIHYSFRASTKYSVNLLVSNNSQCGAMQLATMFEIPTLHLSTLTHPDPKEYSRVLCDTLRAQSIGIIALAGYMKRLPKEVITEYSRYSSARIFNIHPALLPKFGGEGMYGKRVHEAVLAAGEQESGCTVHEVEHEYDTGTIIVQKTVPVLPSDTPDALAARVLEWEHQLYPETLHQKSLEITRGTL